jgi:predicted phage terminase large subunit-like protein
VGVGSGVTGFGASLIVVDDPVKSRAEAESETYRDKVWDWFNDDLYTRLEPDGAIILIQTRWHEDDLAGRLLKEMNEGGEHWDVVNLPALCEEPDVQRNAQEQIATQSSPPYEGGVAASSPTGWFSQPQSTGHLMPDPHTAARHSQEGGLTPAPSSPPRLSVSAVQPAHPHLERVPEIQPTYDPIGRLPGEALWPSRYDEAALEKLRRKLGSYSFSSLYQQRPVPAEGGLFKISWFKNIVFAPPPGLKWHRGYDLAVSTKTTACYTASAKCAFDKEGNLYIADVMRKRMEFPEQRRYIYERVAIEKDTEHGVELALHGHAIIQDLRRAPQLRGRPFRGVKVDADKITRALGWASLAEDGKVFLVRGPWNQEFLNEVREFPSGKYDDQIDAVSIAVRMARHHKARSFWSF